MTVVAFRPERNRKTRALGVGIYTSVQVSRLSAVERGSLGYWKRTGLIVPHIDSGEPGRRALYTYADLRELRVVKQLRRKGLSLQRVRRSIEWLQPHVRQGSSWVENFTLVTDGEHAFTLLRAGESTAVGLPIFDIVQPDFSGHPVITAFVGDIVQQFRQDPDLLYLRGFADWVDIKPEVLAGAPVAKNTRLSTALIHSLTRDGWVERAILDAYPSLTPKGLEMAVKFEEAISQPLAAQLLLLDASVPAPIARALSLLNVPAVHATEFMPDNASDDQIVQAAAERQAILVTLDNDFQSKKHLFLDIAARGITVAVIRPPKHAKMDVIAEIILWSYRKFYEIHDVQGPSAITVKQPTMKARAYRTIEFGRVEPTES